MDQTNLGRIMAKESRGGEITNRKWSSHGTFRHFVSGPFFHRTIVGRRASKETAFFHANSAFYCSESGFPELTRNHKPRKPTQKVFMAGNNQNSDNFTVMLGGRCVQNLSDFGLCWPQTQLKIAQLQIAR